MVHQCMAHGERRRAQEVSVIVPTLHSTELEVSLVDQRRSLHRLTGTDPSPLPSANAPQLFVEERQELVRERMELPGRETGARLAAVKFRICRCHAAIIAGPTATRSAPVRIANALGRGLREIEPHRHQRDPRRSLVKPQCRAGAPAMIPGADGELTSEDRKDDCLRLDRRQLSCQILLMSTSTMEATATSIARNV